MDCSPEGFLMQNHQITKPSPASKPSPPMVPPTAAPMTPPLLDFDDWVAAGLSEDFEREGRAIVPEAAVDAPAVTEPPRVIEALAERA